MSKEGKVWGFRGAQYRNPSRTPMYLPRAHIGARPIFGKFSLVGPKNRFFPEWANVTRYLNFVLQVLFEVGLTPNYRGFNVGNFARDLKFFEFLVISAILRISPIWLDPPPYLWATPFWLEKSNQTTWEAHIHREGAQPIWGQGFMVDNGLFSMLSCKFSFLYLEFTKSHIP